MGLRVASSIQRAICKDVYDAEIATQVAEEGVTIEPGRTERVDGLAYFDTKVAPSCRRAARQRGGVVSIKTVINPL